MAKVKKPSNRYCMVPQCKNTIRSTPDKVFFRIPSDAKLRKQWCKAMRRNNVSLLSCLYCCEDHFNVKEDTANYIQYNIMKQLGEKCNLRLKNGVVPHIFFCQNRNMPRPVERMAILKRQRLALVNEAISEYEKNSNNDLKIGKLQRSHNEASPRNYYTNVCDINQAGPSTSGSEEPVLMLQMNEIKREPITIEIEADVKIKQELPEDPEPLEFNVPNCSAFQMNGLISPKIEIKCEIIEEDTEYILPVKQELICDSETARNTVSNNTTEPFNDTNISFINCSSGYKVEKPAKTFQEPVCSTKSQKDNKNNMYKIKNENNCDYNKKKKLNRKVLSCSFCNYTCTDNISLCEHKRIHSGDQPYMCHICDYRSTRQSHLKSHILMIHTSSYYSCDSCDYKSNVKRNLVRHMKIHSGVKPYACDACDYRTVHKHRIKSHMRKHTNDKPYGCQMCDYRSTHNHMLKSHILIDHSDKKVYFCECCDYNTIVKYNLLRHMRMHSGVKPYACNICSYRTVYKSCIKSHMNKHTKVKRKVY